MRRRFGKSLVVAFLAAREGRRRRQHASAPTLWRVQRRMTASGSAIGIVRQPSAAADPLGGRTPSGHQAGREKTSPPCTDRSALLAPPWMSTSSAQRPPAKPAAAYWWRRLAGAAMCRLRRCSHVPPTRVNRSNTLWSLRARDLPGFRHSGDPAFLDNVAGGSSLLGRL